MTPLSSASPPPLALVTGGSRGIGRAVAERLASDGYDIVITYHQDESAADEVARSLGDRCVGTIRVDLREPQAGDDVIRQVAGSHGGIDVLVNNAGANPMPSSLAEQTVSGAEDTVRLNLLAPYATSSAFAQVPGRGGDRVIVMVSSIYGALKGTPASAAYAASKAGVANLTASMARGFAPAIRVNAVAPGLVDTDMLWRDEEFLSRSTRRTPLGRVADAQDVAAAVAFLVSPEAAFITGVVLPVDGGISL